MKTFCHFLITIFATKVVSQEVKSCHLPAGDVGACVEISRCSHLTKLISNLQKPFPNDVSLIIRDSFLCGASGTQVSVCCPLDGLVSPLENPPEAEPRDTCAMQRGEAAECVNYSNCSPFVQLLVNLKKPLDPVVPRMVRSSYLCGADESTGAIIPKICCPSAALSVSNNNTNNNNNNDNTNNEETSNQEPVNKYESHPGFQLIAEKSECGTSGLQAKIVGGKNATLGQFPWLVNLGYQQDGKGEKLFKCGGTLIGNRHILTAAHCVTDLPRGFVLTTIRVGEHDLASEIDCEGTFCAPEAQDITVENVILHPSYGKPEAFQNDIAIVKLSRNVTRNEFVVPVCLPWADDEENYIDGARTGAEAAITEVAGWGATTPTGRRPATVLQYLDVSVTDAAQCKEIYKERGGVLGESQICAGGVAGKDSCVGDSGSGLMRSLPDEARSGLDRFDLIGIVSFGPRFCGTEGVPGVYTRVNSYLDWILDSVNS